MKKLFKITKSTSECQKLIALYSNMETDTEELIIQKEELFNKIKSIIFPKAKALLAIKSFNIGKSNKDISMSSFECFVIDSLIYYIDKYNPMYYEGLYNRSANFETYYYACMKNSIDLFFKGHTISDYYGKLEKEKEDVQKQREKLHNEYIDNIRAENRPIVKLQNNASKYLITKYSNIAEAEQSEFNTCNENFIINVKKVCDGLAKTSYGHKWMYLDEYESLMEGR